MPLSRSKPLLAAFALLIPACELNMSPDEVVELALVTEDVTVSVAGDDLTVDVLTHGRNTCVSHHDDAVVVDRDARRITMRPYNRRHTEHVCGQMIVEIPHSVTVFDLPEGAWTVRVIGRDPAHSGGERVFEAQATIRVGIIVDNPNGA